MVSKARKRQRAAERHAARQRRKRQESEAASGQQTRETELLTDEKSYSQDMSLIKTSVEKWGGPGDDVMCKVSTRLVEILEKKTVSTVNAKGEVVEDEATADVNAIKSGATLLAIKKAYQEPRNKPFHQPQPNQTVNIGVNVVNSSDERRNRTLAIADRVRTGGVLLIDSPQSDRAYNDAGR